jgi:hypothetical protein
MKTIQSVIGSIKDAVLIVAMIYVFLHAIPAFKTVLTQITSHTRDVKSVELDAKGKVKVELENARSSLQAAVTIQSKTEGKQDQPVPSEAKDIVGAIRQTDDALSKLGGTKPLDAFLDDLPDSGPQRWVYLGIEKGGQWNPNYFNLTGEPKKGQALTAAADVYERDTKPLYVDAIKDWKLGQSIGVLNRGSGATITDVNKIESDNGGQNWWARIK